MAIDDTTADDLGHAQTMAGASEAYCSHCEESYPAGTDVCPADGSRLVQFRDKQDRLIGKLIDDRFEVLSKLGHGAMGDVYRAQQRSVGREVAIKVIKPELSANRVAAKRFLREAKLLSRVTHPNVVVVHDMGQDSDGTLYLVMELVTGRTLAQLLLDDPQMPSSRIKDISLQVCDALEAAHHIGVIHRDLKPSNILVSTSASGRDSVKVLDFGLAKSLAGDDSGSAITATGVVMGTPLYISPEMITGDQVDGRSDLYSLGCLLYEMCSGSPPFVAETTTLLMSKHITEQPRPILRADVAALASVSQALLQKNPDQRPANAATVSRLLNEESGQGWGSTPASQVGGVATPAPPSSAEAVVTGPLQTAEVAREKAASGGGRRWLLLVGALAIGAAVAALVLGGGGDDEAEHREPALAVVDSTDAPKVSIVAPPAVAVDAAVATVTVTLDSRPSAEEVYVAGELKGPGPITVSVPRSHEPIQFSLRHEGYEPYEGQFEPNRDQSMEGFALVKTPEPEVSARGARTTRKSRREPRKPVAKPDTKKPDTKKPDTKPDVDFFQP